MSSRYHTRTASLLSIVASIGAWNAASAQDEQAAAQVRYDNDKVIRATVSTQQDLMTMLAISDDPWSERTGVAEGGELDFRVHAADLAAIDAAGIRYKVLIENVQALIDAERAEMAAARQAGVDGLRGGDDPWFLTYHTFADINSRAAGLVAQHPELATWSSVGASRENRPINAFHLSSPVGGPASVKPAVLLNSLQHAREWVTGMVTMYIADRLVLDYGVDPTATALLDAFEIIIIPVSNPDGYVYSHATDRLWRKNRRLNNPGGGTPVYGVDLNRNWGYQWGRNNGSSGAFSSPTYRGPSAFSEPCTVAIRDFISSRDHILLHIDVHSYGQLVLWPWDYSTDPVPLITTFTDLGLGMRQAILDSGGVHYDAYSGVTLYPASGTMPDWTYGVRGALGYTIEVRDTGQFGFLLPASQILPTASEIYAAFRDGAIAVLPCRADWNQSGGGPDSQDLFDFLESFFSGAADFNGDSATDSQDFFEFVETFFSGCGPA